MTTIAFDGKTLAGDTSWQSSYNQQHHTPKIGRRAGIAWGVSGYGTDAVQFNQWMRAGRPADAKPKLDGADCFSAIVIEGGEAVRYEGASLTVCPAGVPAATGSGCEIAMGAMMAGASAKRAVEIAIILNSDSGGRVNTINCTKRHKKAKLKATTQ